MRSQRDPTIFTFSFPSPGYCLSLSFCPVLLLYKAAAGFRDERHLFGSLQRVTKNPKSHLYCRAVHSPFYIQYGGDDQKDQS